MKQYHCLDIHNYVNNKGITSSRDYSKGSLSLGGSSLPIEEFPNENCYCFYGVPFKFCIEDHADNIELEGQTINIPTVVTNEISFLGVSCNSDLMDTVHFLFDETIVQSDKLYFSDLLSEKPAFKDESALKFSYLNTRVGKQNHFKPNIWYSSIKFLDYCKINKIMFEDNPFMHIFAITMHKS